jgi:hypothetical protein
VLFEQSDRENLRALVQRTIITLDKDATIPPKTSFINFSKRYNVLHSLPIARVGSVRENSLDQFVQQFESSVSRNSGALFSPCEFEITAENGVDKQYYSLAHGDADNDTTILAEGKAKEVQLEKPRNTHNCKPISLESSQSSAPTPRSSANNAESKILRRSTQELVVARDVARSSTGDTTTAAFTAIGTVTSIAVGGGAVYYSRKAAKAQERSNDIELQRAEVDRDFERREARLIRLERDVERREAEATRRENSGELGNGPAAPGNQPQRTPNALPSANASNQSSTTVSQEEASGSGSFQSTDAQSATGLVQPPENSLARPTPASTIARKPVATSIQRHSPAPSTQSPVTALPRAYIPPVNSAIQSVPESVGRHTAATPATTTPAINSSTSQRSSSSRQSVTRLSTAQRAQNPVAQMRVNSRSTERRIHTDDMLDGSLQMLRAKYRN